MSAEIELLSFSYNFAPSPGVCATASPNSDSAAAVAPGRPQTAGDAVALHMQHLDSASHRPGPGFGEERAWAASWAGTRSSPDRAPSACSLVASTRVDARRCGDRELALRRTEPAVDLNVRA